MGIAKTGFNTLLELTKDTELGGCCIQIGRQSIALDREQVLDCSRRWHREARANELLSSGLKIDDELIFKILGFDDVESIDFSDYESPTHIADLNKPLPVSLHGKFDFVYDGGSSEHIFDFSQVLRNYHSMLKDGGIIAHAIPSTNHLDHGFYMFSPTLLWDYYLANNYKIIRSYIVEYNYHAAMKGAPSRIWQYHPSNICNQFAGWDGNNLLLWFVVRKLPKSTCDVVPQQGVYRGIWGWEESDSRSTEIAQLLPSHMSGPEIEAALPGAKSRDLSLMGLARKYKLTSLARKLGIRDLLHRLGVLVPKPDHGTLGHSMRQVGYF
ncbi:MAG: hypothetical protein WCQ20_07030 [Synechococcaceae cyanobacterium ELA739]